MGILAEFATKRNVISTQGDMSKLVYCGALPEEEEEEEDDTDACAGTLPRLVYLNTDASSGTLPRCRGAG